MRFPNFINGSYTNQNLTADCQRTVNLYVEINEERTAANRETGALFGTPGLTAAVSLGNGPIRGLYYASNGLLYCVSGNTLYSLDAGFVPTTVGTLNTTTGRVPMMDNGYQLCLVDGTGYVWDWGLTTWTLLGGVEGFQGSNVCGVIDGWGVYAVPGTNQFYTSNQNDFTTYNGTTASPSANYSFKAGQSDPIVSLLCDHELCWLFGQKTSEVWYNAQNSTGVVLSRMPNTLIETGCCGQFTPQQVMNSIIWLGDGRDGPGVVWQCQGGYVPNRISTHAVEDALISYGYPALQNTTAWTYQDRGHGFYCLNVPGAPVTWVYDVITGLWHERMFLANGAEQRHRAECHAYAFGYHVVGDYQTNQLYFLDPANPTDNGAIRKWIRRAPHVSADLNRVIFQSIQLDMETGIGGAQDTPMGFGAFAGDYPQIMLRWSDDAGHTWSPERLLSAGDIGKYQSRVRATRLGSSRNRVWEFSGTNPISQTILGAELGIKVCRS